MDDFLENISRTQFLGAEFLTWLWYQEEKNDGKFDLGEEGIIELYFEDKLSLSAMASDEQEDSFKGGRPTTSLEARSALKLGKLVKNARLRLIQGDQDWIFNVKAEPLMMSAIKLPTVLSTEITTAFFERMFLIERLDKIYHCLLSRFLQIRLSDAWDTELNEIQTWVKN
jgi:hypothetical protein